MKQRKSPLLGSQRPFSSFLPRPRKKRVLLQASVDKDLIDETRMIMKRDNIRWNDLIEACLKLFVQEMREPK